jgi:hypothetical protein
VNGWVCGTQESARAGRVTGAELLSGSSGPGGSGGSRREEDGARDGVPPLSGSVFLSDPTAEAERVAQALRARGCTVVDVPQAMLAARVAVQRPSVVLLDADGAGAFDVAARVREIPGQDEIHVLYLGRPGGSLQTPDEALARSGTGLFLRPVDVGSLVDRVCALLGARRVPPDRPSAPSLEPRSSPGAAASARSLPPASMRAELADASLSGVAVQADGALMRKLAGIAPPVSPELQQILAEAEQRIQLPAFPALAGQAGDAAASALAAPAPSPEEEIEAVLPEELLASLDAAIDEDDDDEEVVAAPPRAPAHAAHATHGRERTDGGGTRTTGASTTGSGTPAKGTPVQKSASGESITPPPLGANATPIATTPAPPEPPALSALAVESAARRETPSVPPDAAPSTLHAPPSVLEAGTAARAVALAIGQRTTASLCFSTGGVERRLVLREGDILTAASTAADEALISFLGARGDLPRETVRRLTSKFPPFGRHAGAALVARGYLLQDQMWPTLRAHAEWIVGRVMQMPAGQLTFEPQPPGRLAGEPSVFGGSSGAEVFVDLVRRTVSTEDAIARLGGLGARVMAGGAAALLGEVSLAPAELAQMRAAPGHTLRDALGGTAEGDVATLVLALTELGVFEVLVSPAEDEEEDRGSAPDIAALDVEAVKERVRARLQVVEDGDYFAVLGVSRDATGYEVKRAYLNLRRSFDASRVLTPEVAALAPEVRRITVVLEEAYEILRDPARRERYRRAIEAVPEATP